MQRPTDPVIEISNLVKHFGDVRALNALSFDVQPGTICGFLGPNGSGKSTTLRILTSLVKADSGSVKMFGQDLGTSREKVLSTTGVLIERPNFYEHFTARRNLSILMRYSHARLDKKRIDEVLSLIGLAGRADHKVGGFSEGMKQRLGLGQALLAKPNLLILDEPFNSLDPQGVKDIRELLGYLIQDEEMTVLVSSHNLDEIEKLSTHMVLIKEGRAIANGKVSDLLAEGRKGVIVEIESPERAVEILGRTAPDLKAQVLSNGKVRFNITKSDIPSLLEVLASNQINVYGISDGYSLEQFFLTFTEP